jgi:hypothetical protein
VVGMKNPLTAVVVGLLVAHNLYTLWIMRLAVERPLEGLGISSPLVRAKKESF